jgi:cyclopropane-fatty-acyl-phospholipid synthase
MDTSRQLLANLLAEAGVQVDGGAPWDLRVKDDRLFREVMLKKNLGLGEGYMLGWWDCERVDELICRVLKSGTADRVRGCWQLIVRLVPSLLVNLQSLSRARIVARRHYDLGNDLFQAFLDSYLQYSCAYFKGMACEPDPLQLTADQVSRDLEAAQQSKMRLICEKLDLKPGETLLDIGCGWGGLARFAAENYGCTVTGVNISRRQIDFAREFCKGLPVEIREADYRLLHGSYDKIVSVGMFEHVGYKNYRTFMETAARCLAPDGLFLLHTIGSNATSPDIDPWISKYIFPNGVLPSIAQISRAAEKWFTVEDLHNFGPDYDRTLLCWLRKFRAAWPDLKQRYGQRFGRMWEYYLQSCAGCFRARDIQLWQIVFTKIGRDQPGCRLT